MNRTLRLLAAGAAWLFLLPLHAADPANPFAGIMETVEAKTEQAAKPEVLTRSVLLFCRFAPDAAFSQSQRQLLVESLVIKLGAASAQIRLRQYPRYDVEAAADMDQIALLSGADAWMSVLIGGTMAQSRVEFRARDLQRNQDFFTHLINTAMDTRFRNAFGGLWTPVAAKMAETIRPFRQFNQLSVEGPAGVPVSISNGYSQTLDAEGKASVSVISPASYQWALYVPGFKQSSGTVFVERDTSFTIEPSPRLPLVIGVGLEWLGYPMIGLGAYLVPDQLAVEFQGVFYDIGLTPSLPASQNPSLINPQGLFNLLGGLRWQILEHRFPVQLNLGIGGHLRYLTTGGMRIDPLTPGGIYAVLGASLDIIPELALAVELAPRVSFSSDPALALSGVGLGTQASSLANLTLAFGPVLVEPLHYSIGLRIQP